MPFYWIPIATLNEPPRPSQVTRRRPRFSGSYWESIRYHKADAMDSLWERWERTTGRKVPPEVRAARPLRPKVEHSVPTTRASPDERRVQRAGGSET